METQGDMRTVAGIIDEGPWTRFQKMIFVLVALTIISDGFDAQVIGFSIPVIAEKWQVSRAAFASVIGAGVVGMMVGSTLVSLVVDRIGRRATITGAVLIYGLATLVTAAAGDLFSLAALRFVAGLGIGAALPTASTIAAEFTPARHRTAAIIVAIVCVPLGGVLAGLVARFVIPAAGWESLFLIGGAFPLILAFVLFRSLPESPSWLALKPDRRDELVGLLNRLGARITPEQLVTPKADLTIEARQALVTIFGRDLARSTVSLWAMCLLTMLTVYSTFNWLPAVLTGSGVAPAQATDLLTAYNFGGVVGSLLCALAVTRAGSRPILVPMAAVAALSAFAASTFDPTVQTSALIAVFAINGSCVNGLQAAIYALCAHSYATSIRGFGTSLTLGVGRVGAIASAIVGTAFVGATGFKGFLLFSSVTMLGVMIMLLIFNRHIAPAVPRQSRGGVEVPDPLS